MTVLDTFELEEIWSHELDLIDLELIVTAGREAAGEIKELNRAGLDHFSVGLE